MFVELDFKIDEQIIMSWITQSSLPIGQKSLELASFGNRFNMLIIIRAILEF